MSKKFIISFLSIVISVCSPITDYAAKAGDPDFLTLSLGWFDFNRQKDPGAEFRIEYRSNKKLWQFKPFFMLSGASNAMTFAGAGVLMDAYIGRRWVITPSFAPTLWRGATDDLDLGHVVELGTTDQVFSPPYHPYTEALLSAVPIADTSIKKEHIVLEGDIPSAMNPPSGCVFRTRCPHASTDGKEGNIEMGLVEVKPGHWLDKCGVNCGKI